MLFERQPLPYARTALEPYLSEETLRFHYGKHHQSYVDNLNDLVQGTAFEGRSLEEIVRTSKGGIYNNAAQVWNHDFYWRSLAPNAGGEPGGKLSVAIDSAFGSFAAFQEKFTASALGNFGSGWTWLVRKADGSVGIVNTSDAGNPLREGHIPLLTCDVWEHAYYIDYRNDRAAYMEGFWALANWEFANTNFG